MTQAEQLLDAFHTSTKTISIVTLAKRAKAHVERKGNMVRYLMPDGSSLATRGRGKNHTAWISS